jgi:TPR repeat protein
MNAQGATGAAAAVAVDRAETIKWWEALHVIAEKGDVQKGVAMARESQHPDARWLVALLPPPGEELTVQRVREVMLAQGDDPRALYLAWHCGPRQDLAMIRRSAELGDATAQALLSAWEEEAGNGERAFELAQRSAAQGQRYGLYQLGSCYENGVGCTKDLEKAKKLYKEGADWDYGACEFAYGNVAFSVGDAELFYWRGRAALHGFQSVAYCTFAIRFCPYFERDQQSRILHTMTPAIRVLLDSAELHGSVTTDDIVMLQRVVQLYEEMLARARRAIACCSMAIRRRGGGEGHSGHDRQDGLGRGVAMGREGASGGAESEEE